MNAIFQFNFSIFKVKYFLQIKGHTDHWGNANWLDHFTSQGQVGQSYNQQSWPTWLLLNLDYYIKQPVEITIMTRSKVKIFVFVLYKQV